MIETKIGEKLDNPLIKGYLKSSGLSSVDEIVELAINEYIENKIEKKETQVDKWIKTLNELVSWANNGG